MPLIFLIVIVMKRGATVQCLQVYIRFFRMLLVAVALYKSSPRLQLNLDISEIGSEFPACPNNTLSSITAPKVLVMRLHNPL